MSDLIDRQAAINAVNTALFPKINTAKDAVKALRDLPAAEPERKKGKWIPHREKSREYIGTVLVSVEYDYWLCDACGYRVENGQPMYNFCPYCGADMRTEGV